MKEDAKAEIKDIKGEEEKRKKTASLAMHHLELQRVFQKRGGGGGGWEPDAATYLSANSGFCQIFQSSNSSL